MDPCTLQLFISRINDLPIDSVKAILGYVQCNPKTVEDLYDRLCKGGNYECLPLFTSYYSFRTIWKRIIRCASSKTIDHLLDRYEYLNMCELQELYCMAKKHGRCDVAKNIHHRIKCP